jgi:hypothetical protein
VRSSLVFVLALTASCSSAQSVPSATAGTGGSGSTGAGGGAGTLGTAGAAGFGPFGNPFGAFGSDTGGGKGGTVLRVTTLASSGPGSLREALATPGPRVIVFEVGGVIDLALARLDISEPFVTVAGQTAPSPGITLVRGGVRVLTHDVIVTHLRVRMGSAGAAPASGFEPDVTTDGAAAYNVLFDHVSVAWGVDENLSVSGPRFGGPAGTSHAVTIRNSIIAEGLMNSVHEKGAHSMGTLIHDYCTDIAVVGNLYAHNHERNPWFKGFASGVVVNNLVYDPGLWAIRLGPVDKEWTDAGIVPEGPQVSVVGNVMRYGASSTARPAMVGTNSRGSAYLEDNVALDASGDALEVAGSGITMLAEKPAWPAGLVALPTSAVVESVLARAGARPQDRDAVDTRIVADFMGGTGRIIDSQDDVGGYPAPAPTTRKLDVPEDVDAWLATLAAELE